MRSINEISLEKIARPWERGICSLYPLNGEDNRGGGGGGRIGSPLAGTAPLWLQDRFNAALSQDPDFSNCLHVAASGFAGAGAQRNDGSFRPPDLELAAHLNACNQGRRLAAKQKVGSGGMTPTPVAAAQNPFFFVIAILFLVWVLR